MKLIAKEKQIRHNTKRQWNGIRKRRSDQNRGKKPENKQIGIKRQKITEWQTKNGKCLPYRLKEKLNDIAIVMKMRNVLLVSKKEMQDREKKKFEDTTVWKKNVEWKKNIYGHIVKNMVT